MDARVKPEHDSIGGPILLSFVMLGLDPSIHVSPAQAFVKIIPMGVVALDQRDLPVAHPVLQALFPLDGLFGAVIESKTRQERTLFDND
jgi:hypothetical protein